MQDSKLVYRYLLLAVALAILLSFHSAHAQTTQSFVSDPMASAGVTSGRSDVAATPSAVWRQSPKPDAPWPPP